MRNVGHSSDNRANFKENVTFVVSQVFENPCRVSYSVPNTLSAMY